MFLLQSCEIILKCFIKEDDSLIKFNIAVIYWEPVFFIITHSENRELLLVALEDFSTLLNSQTYITIENIYLQKYKKFLVTHSDKVQAF